MGFGQFLAVCLTGYSLAPTIAQSFESVPVETLFHQVKATSLAERIEAFSEKFIGAPYVDGPLGEGPHGKYDQGPLYRTDEFDCTTYVETVLALARSRAVPEFERTLKRIRYHGRMATFPTRNHFPCADWIPNNEAAGFVVDITAQVAGSLGTEMAKAVVDKNEWYEHLTVGAVKVKGLTPSLIETRLAELHREGKSFKPRTVTLPYLPLNKFMQHTPPATEEISLRAKAEAEYVENRKRLSVGLENDPEAAKKFEADTHAGLIDLRLHGLIKDVQVDMALVKRIPSGTILSVVRPNWKIPGTHMNVSHQGFVIHKKDEVYFRHGSRAGGERIKDVPLANYLRLCLLTPEVKGIHLLQPVEPSSP